MTHIKQQSSQYVFIQKLRWLITNAILLKHKIKNYCRIMTLGFADI